MKIENYKYLELLDNVGKMFFNGHLLMLMKLESDEQAIKSSYFNKNKIYYDCVIEIKYYNAKSKTWKYYDEQQLKRFIKRDTSELRNFFVEHIFEPLEHLLIKVNENIFKNN